MGTLPPTMDSTELTTLFPMLSTMPMLPSTTLPLPTHLPQSTTLPLSTNLPQSTTPPLLSMPPLSTNLPQLSTSLPQSTTPPLLSMPLPPTSPLTQHLLTMSPLMMAQPSTNMVTLSLMTILVPLFLKVKTVMVMLPLVNTVSLFPMVVPKLSNTQLGMPTPDTSLMSHTRVRPTMILMCPQRPLLTMPKKHIY